MASNQGSDEEYQGRETTLSHLAAKQELGRKRQ
jgi:hypothetical protein